MSIDAAHDSTRPRPAPAARDVSARLRSAIKLAALLAASAVAMPAQALLLRFTRGRPAFVLPRLWHRWVRAILGIRVEVVGRRDEGGAVVFVGNHVSHFDIPLIGSVLPARFVAKDDMARWPGIPSIAGLQQTIFISRRARDAARVAAQIEDAVRRRHDLVLFAEGTTSSGERVAPFKSSLFAPLIGAAGATATRAVQPFTIELVAIDGRPVRTAAERDVYAYYGDMDAGAHVRRFLRGCGAHLRLHLHPPIALHAGMDRKQLAARVHAVVAAPLARTAAPASGG